MGKSDTTNGQGEKGVAIHESQSAAGEHSEGKSHRSRNQRPRTGGGEGKKIDRFAVMLTSIKCAAGGKSTNGTGHSVPGSRIRNGLWLEDRVYLKSPMVE